MKRLVVFMGIFAILFASSAFGAIVINYVPNDCSYCYDVVVNYQPSSLFDKPNPVVVDTPRYMLADAPNLNNVIYQPQGLTFDRTCYR